MGEAKQRRDALRHGKPLERDMHRCPNCQSAETIVRAGPPMALSHIPTLYGVCGDCETLWEAFPPSWKHDAVEGEPCDNCAFRPGSPEVENREEWRSMLAKLKAGQVFHCHKGAPIRINREDLSMEFDRDWVSTKGRTCVGFLRAVWKWGDWLENRTTHVLTKHDQDKILGFNPED